MGCLQHFQNLQSELLTFFFDSYREAIKLVSSAAAGFENLENMKENTKPVHSPGGILFHFQVTWINISIISLA